MTTIPGNNYTYIGTDLTNALGYLITRTPTANSTDTLPTATDIILSFVGINDVANNGQSFGVSIFNNSTFMITLNTGTGVTFTGISSDTILPLATRTYTFVQTAVSTVSCYIIGGAPNAPSTNSGIMLSTNNILVGNTNNIATGVTMSNDATIANTGALTLASVNGNVGSFTAANITVNAKGLITAAANGSGGGGPGGSNTQVQFNNSGVLGGSANLTWDGTSLNVDNIDSISTVGTLWPSTTTANVASSTDSNVQTSTMTWTASAPDATKSWTSVCWGLNQFVAVSNSAGAAAGLVRTSPDGITWTSRTATSVNTWVAICWAPDIQLFAAVSSNGAVATQVMTSPNGITWTARTVPTARVWTCICRGTLVPGNGTGTGTGNIFVAMASDGTSAQQIASSPDGTTWTARTVPLALTWTSVCWSDDVQLFVAVASNGTAAQQINTSPDGITWTARTSPSAQQWQSVCWSPLLSLFCAVASNGTAAQQIMTSPNGITWTAATSPSAQQWQSVCWSPCFKMFVSVANNGTTAQQIMYSSTGTGTWTAATSTSATTWRSICFSDFSTKRFVAVANTAVAGNGMYSNSTLSDYNTTVNLGTLGVSNINLSGSNVNIFPVPYYYGESTVSILLTGANTFVTDITISNVANGTYICQIWIQAWIKTGVIASTTEQFRIIGSVQGTIFTTPPAGSNGPQSMVGSAGTSVGMGSRFFQFMIKSNSSTNFQDVSYQLAATSISNPRPFSTNGGILRTMYLNRIS